MLGQVIAVASGKGGTGKTTISANLAVALCALGEKVLLIDADIGLRCLDMILGMTDHVLFSFGDVICGRATLKQAAVTHPIVKNLYLLTAPASFEEKEAQNPKNIDAFLKYARRHFSYIIIDSAAGIGGLNIALGASADRCIVVSTPDETSLRGAQTIAVKLMEAGCSQIKIVVNRVRKGAIRHKDSPDIDRVMDTAGLGLLGIVPEDLDIQTCSNKQRILMLHSLGKAQAAFTNIARRIKGERVRLLNI